jgi:hypothetical protein
MGQGDPVRKAYFLAYPQRVKCGLSVSNGNETDLILPCSAKGFLLFCSSLRDINKSALKRRVCRGKEDH